MKMIDCEPYKANITIHACEQNVKAAKKAIRKISKGNCLHDKRTPFGRDWDVNIQRLGLCMKCDRSGLKNSKKAASCFKIATTLEYSVRAKVNNVQLFDPMPCQE